MAERAPVTAEMRARFEEEAYVHIRKPVFLPNDFLNLKNYLFSYIETVPERLRPTFFTSNPFIKPPAYADWINREEIISLIEPFVGPNLVFLQLSLCYKPPNSVYRVPLHTDSYYSVLQKGSPGSVTNMFISLTDCTKESGCLRFLPKINEHKVYKHKAVNKEFNFFQGEIDDPILDLSKMVDVEMKANEACVFKHSIVHESRANSSPEPRLGMTLRFAPSTYKFITDINHRGPRHLLKGENLAQNNFQNIEDFPIVGNFSWSKK